MLRVVAFLCGVLVGVVLVLGVAAGISHSPQTTAAVAAKALTVEPPQDSGQVFTNPVDPHGDSLGEDEEEEGGQINLEGDEVTAAVAKYRFDAQGNIYETHAPHTEVPRLGRPQL